MIHKIMHIYHYPVIQFVSWVKHSRLLKLFLAGNTSQRQDLVVQPGLKLKILLP